MLKAEDFNIGYVLMVAVLAPGLAYVSVFLTGGGHAPLIGYVPFLLVTGPVAVLWQVLDPYSKLFPELVLIGSSLLYLFYGTLLWVASIKFPHQYAFIFKVILSLHLLAGVVFLYRGGFV